MRMFCGFSSTLRTLFPLTLSVNLSFILSFSLSLILSLSFIVAPANLAEAAGPSQVSNEKNSQNARNDESRAKRPLLRPYVIYGQDGRVDLYEVKNATVQTLARSSVALIEDAYIKAGDKGMYQVFGDSLEKRLRVCTTERFSQQKSVAYCSGTLIAPDLVLTAGHCVADTWTCETTTFVFDFRIRDATDPLETVDSARVYRCKKLEWTQVEDTGDFALIRLDRTVTDRNPVDYRTKADIQSGDPVFVLGHPLGLPLKLTDAANVRRVDTAFFLSDTDTYVGNSGSPVFNANSGLLEGVLVQGEDDFETKGSCLISKVCEQNACRGESSTSMSAIRPVLGRLLRSE